MISIFMFFSLVLYQLLSEVPVCSSYYVYVPMPPPPESELKKALIYYDTNPDSIRQPIRDLVQISRLIEAKKAKELKEFLSKASCENKIQYRYNITYEDSVKIIKVKHSGMISLSLVSMIGCPAAQVHAARLRIFSYETSDCDYTSRRVRDFTEVLVTVSETGQMHDDFIKFYGLDALKSTFESRRELGLVDDVENVCFELINRRRADSSSTKIDPKKAAENLNNEMTHWKNKRKTLDHNLMETPLEQVPSILDAYKSFTNQPLEDALLQIIGEDYNKMTIYKQLVKLGTNRTEYLADEINARQNVDSDFIERSFPLANTITMMAVLSNEDRRQLEDEYKKKFNVNLMEEIDRMLPTLDFGEVITEVLRMYVNDMKKK